jgi:hypothetical protein
LGPMSVSEGWSKWRRMSEVISDIDVL